MGGEWRPVRWFIMRHFLPCFALLGLVALGCGDDEGLFDGNSTGTGGSGAAGGGLTGGSGNSGGAGAGSTGGQSSGGAGGAGGTGGAPTMCPGGAPGCVEDWAGQFGVQGSVDGTGQAAQFEFVAGMTSTGGFLYVSSDHAIRRIDIATAAVTTWVGQSGTNAHVDDPAGTGIARFDDPVGLATDGTTLWVADRGNRVIRAVDIATKQVTTLSGSGGTGGLDGPSGVATFDAMRELTYDGANLFLIEASGVLRRINPNNGNVVTVAGLYNTNGLADGTGPIVRFDAARFVTAVAQNELYVADTENHRPRHVAVAANLGTVSSPYGSSQGYADGTGPAAQFDRLRGVAFDGTDLIVGDADNFCIRKIDLATDEVTTIAGQPGVQAHAVGIGAAAAFDKPLDIHYDPDTGDIFISEGSVIRRFYYQ